MVARTLLNVTVYVILPVLFVWCWSGNVSGKMRPLIDPLSMHWLNKYGVWWNHRRILGVGTSHEQMSLQYFFYLRIVLFDCRVEEGKKRARVGETGVCILRIG